MNGKQQWSPLTKLIWLVLGGGAIIGIVGWLAVTIFVIVNVGVALILGVVAVSGSREGAARDDAELDAIMSAWRDASPGTPAPR